MGNVVSNSLFIVSSFFISFVEIFVWSRFYSEKINYRNVFLYLCIIILSMLGMLNHLYVNVFVRTIIVTFLMCFCNWLVFKKKIIQTIVSTMYGQFILVFADAIFIALCILLFNGDMSYVKDNLFDTFLANIFVAIIYLLICNNLFIINFYHKIVFLTNKIRMKNIILVCVILIISVNFLTSVVYFYLKPVYVIIVNCILLFVYSFIIYRAINEKNNSMIVKAQNDSLMSSLHQYEDMVDRQRVDNHENKNQLLIIKNMIKKKDKDVVKYIDTIVKDQKEDDEALYTRVMTIPSGGLQGIIYQKMLVMKDEHIKFSLDVGRGVRDFELDKLSMDDNYRLCKIVGVFLDNAIEESRKINDKCIMISLYVDDDNLVIEVSNRFEGKIDIDKLDESGYTTKGDGHGYGLSLVKKILSETDKFENVRSINRNVFKQIIKIKNT